MPYTVFISSTSRDLLDHRAAAAKALLNAGFHPIDMANFMARPEGATNACLKEVAAADLFVGIYAWRYGFIPPDSEVSITEQEFIEAEKLGKPCFCFVIDETYDWPDEFRDKGIGARLLRDFKARIDSRLVRTTFTSPEDLAGKILASLQRWEREHPQIEDRDPGGTTAAGPVFNMEGAQIEAGIVNQGGEQHFSAPVNIDMRETNTSLAAGATYVAGDQFSGNFQGAIVNIKSNLENVSQAIGNLPDVERPEKDELIRLVQELNRLLAQVPAEMAREAERVLKRVETLVDEIGAGNPDKDIVTTTAESLKQAAQNLSEVLPTVLPIATQIVAHVLKLVG